MRTSIFFVAACSVAIGSMACSPPDLGSEDTFRPAAGKKTERKESTEDAGDESDHRSSDTGDESDTQTRDSGSKGEIPTTVKYSASIATSPSVPFGGAPYCDFNVTMEDIDVELVEANDGGIVSARVTNKMVEGIEGVCPYPVTPPKSHAYLFSVSGERVAGGGSLSMVGQTSNLPKTALTMDTKRNGARYDVTLTWARSDDQPSNLLWKVTAMLSLDKS